MPYNNQVKLVLMLTGIFLFNGVLQSTAYGDNSNKAGDPARGAKVWADNCARCHNYRAPTEFSATDSHVIMQHMRIQAGLMGQEARDVYAFLAAQSVTTPAATSPSASENTPVESTVSAAPGSTKKHTADKLHPADKNPSQAASGGQPGVTVYNQTCVACHAASGKGAMPGVSDFTNKKGPLSKSDSVLLQHIIKGYQSPGSAMAMPPRGGNANLTNKDLQNALSYIRQKFGP